MHTRVHTYTYAHIHAYTHTDRQIYTYIYTRMLTHMHTCTRAHIGAVHKVRHARGGGGVRGVTVCDRGGGQEHVTSRLYKFLSYIQNMKFKVMFNFLL